MYKYNNAETDKTKHLNIDDLASKWSAPIKDGASGKWIGGKFVADAEPSIAEGASGKWIGGKFVQDAAGTTGATQSQYFNNTPEQQNFVQHHLKDHQTHILYIYQYFYRNKHSFHLQ